MLLILIVVILPLEALVMIVLVLTGVVVVVVTGVIVLVTELIFVRKATVDAQDTLQHADHGLSSEVASVHMMDFPLLDFFRGQDAVIEKLSRMLLVMRMQVATFKDDIAFSNNFDLVIKCLPHDLVSILLVHLLLKADSVDQV